MGIDQLDKYNFNNKLHIKSSMVISFSERDKLKKGVEELLQSPALCKVMYYLKFEEDKSGYKNSALRHITL